MKQSKNKSIILAIVIAAVIIAAGVAIYLMFGKSAGEQDGSTTQEDGQPVSVSIEEQRVIATIPTQQRDIDFELMAPQRTGDTLVFNYNLVNASDDKDQGWNVTGSRTGVYTVASGEDGPLNSPVREAYATASDGQRYGLVVDDEGRPLVTERISADLFPDDRIGGYFTISLPPSGSTISLYPGNIQAINGIKIEY